MPPDAPHRPDPLAALAVLPGVPEAVEASRRACEELRWHPALRRLTPQCRAEAVVRAAHASAALDGARLPLDVVRDVSRGAVAAPDDVAGRVVLGAVRALARAEQLAAAGERGLAAAPQQALAGLHVVAAAGLLAEADLGRPRRGGEAALDIPSGADVPGADAVAARLDALATALAGTTSAPALVVAAVAHAEVLSARPFVAGNAVVARALARVVVVGRGLDPTGVAVPEVGHLADADAYGAALAAYRSGTATGVAAWVVHCADALVAGVQEGQVVAGAVLAGRLDPA